MVQFKVHSKTNNSKKGERIKTKNKHLKNKSVSHEVYEISAAKNNACNVYCVSPDQLPINFIPH